MYLSLLGVGIRRKKSVYDMREENIWVLKVLINFYKFYCKQLFLLYFDYFEDLQFMALDVYIKLYRGSLSIKHF